MVGDANSVADALSANDGKRDQDVNFQDVVHSVLAREADVTTTSVILRRTEWTSIRMPV